MRHKTTMNPIRFNLRNPSSDKPQIIYLIYRYIYKNKKVKVHLSTGEKIPPSFWDDRKQRVKTNLQHSKSDYLIINQRLNEFEDKTIEVYREFRNTIPADQFKTKILKRMDLIEDDSKLTFIEFFEQHLRSIEDEKGKQHQTYKNYKTILSHLKAVQEFTGTPISYDDINYQFVENYKQWWFSKDGSNSVNTISAYFSKMKSVLKLAYKKGYHKNMAFDDKDLSIKGAKTKNKIRLTNDELNAFKALDLSKEEELERVRDLAYAMTMVGVRFSDIRKISLDKIKTDGKNKYLEIATKKTVKPVLLPVLPDLEEILQKYNGRLPIMSEQHLNRTIKPILKRCIPNSTYTRIYSENGKTKADDCYKWQYASSHAMRRTFASNFYSMGVPLKAIQNILGHSSERMTRIYLDLDSEEFLNDFYKAIEDKK